MSRHLLPRFTRNSIRPITGLVLTVTMLFVTVPPTIARAFVRDAVQRSTEIGSFARGLALTWSPKLTDLSVTGLATLLRTPSARQILAALQPSTQRGADDGGHMPARPPMGPAVTPQQAAPREEREGRISSLRLNTRDDMELQSHQRIFLSAIPLDSAGSPVQGLRAEWESNNSGVVIIDRSGEAVAGRPGNAVLRARAGRVTQTIHVRVVEGDLDEFGNKRRPGSSTKLERRNGILSSAPGRTTLADKRKERHHAGVPNSIPAAHGVAKPLFSPPPPVDDPLPDERTSSLYLASNSVGAPEGKTVSGTAPAPIPVTENPGSQNFTLGLPVFSLPGRGLDASLSLVHNSQLFNKSSDGSHTFINFDVDSGWPAPGWRLGYGQIESQGGYEFTLTDPDGTRHQLGYTSGYDFDTTDGSFIRFNLNSRILYYPDGTQITYHPFGSGYRIYPIKIVDPNGNKIEISYVGGLVGPKIATITDTLNRVVTFYYASNGDLVTITAPGLGSQSERAITPFPAPGLIGNRIRQATPEFT